MSRLTFSVSRRLLDRADFLRCYDEGRRLFSANFVVFIRRREDARLPWRLGMAVTRKLGTAVWRNRIRRVLREAFRCGQEAVPLGYDIVVVPKRRLNPRTVHMRDVQGELMPLMRQLKRKAE